MKFLLHIIALAAVCAANAQGTFEAITGYVGGSTAVNVFGTGGWTFQVSSGLSVTELGCFTNVVGSQGTIQVGLWSNGGGLLASNSITTASSLVNQTYYDSITPVALVPGQTYRIGAYSASGSILLTEVGPGLGGSFTPSADVNPGAGARADGGFVFPGTTDVSGSMFLGPNFIYNRNVPEPSAWALFGLGLLGLATWQKAGRKS
jgi:hypothetical protein